MTESNSPSLLDADIPCRKCSYNLRSLPTDGLCPECATPIPLSIKGDLLCYSDPVWLKSLHNGARFIIFGVLVFVLAAIANVIFAMNFHTSQASILLLLLTISASLLILGGWWLLTSPDPSGIGEDKYGTFRKIIRIYLIFTIVATLLQYLQRAVPEPLRVLISILHVGLQFFGVVGVVCQWQYLRRLARRIPDSKLSGRSNFLSYALGITYGIIAVYDSSFIITQTPVSFRPQNIAFVFIIIAGFGIIIFGIFSLLTIEKFGKRMKEQAALAHQFWSAPAAPVLQP